MILVTALTPTIRTETHTTSTGPEQQRSPILPAFLIGGSAEDSQVVSSHPLPPFHISKGEDIGIFPSQPLTSSPSNAKGTEETLPSPPLTSPPPEESEETFPSPCSDARPPQREPRMRKSDTKPLPLAPPPVWLFPYHAQRPVGQSNPVSARARSTYTPGSCIPAPPRLTPPERAILMENGGCAKCRQIQTYHQGKCTNAVPSGDGYKPVAYRSLGSVQSTDKSNIPVAFVQAGEASTASMDSSPVHPSLISHASLPHDQPRHRNIATRPRPIHDLAPSHLPNRTAMQAASSSHVHASRDNQFTWLCKLGNPSSTASTDVRALIDTGAAVVLVHERLVGALGLEIHQLAKPLPILTATGTRKFLTHFVDLHLSSPDLTYTATPVKAVICDTLSNDVILGLPFLKKNFVTIDTAEGTVKDKRSGYTFFLKHKRPRGPGLAETLRSQLKTTRAYRRSLLEDLRHKLRHVKRTLDEGAITSSPPEVLVAAITDRIQAIEDEACLELERKTIFSEFAEVLGEIPHADELPTEVLAEIKLKDAHKVFQTRTYSCPRKYRAAWQTLIQQHLDAGRIQESSASSASPAFIIPKSDPTALPRWVNDYRQLNKNTVPDKYPLPRVDDILADCAKGKIWGTIDMTNAFFQTRMKPSDIPLTAVSTPFGMYEWRVMPMGLRNAPAIHQRRVNQALRKYIGRFCHIYLDDIIIWSDSVEEHREHARLIFCALKEAGLYCNLKKTNLFRSEVRFLGHKINVRGIFPDDQKIERILQWPVPTSTKEVRQFLGLVRYLAAFLPQLAKSAQVLNKLTTKECELDFPPWTAAHQTAFQCIKDLVLGSDCLTVIDHTLMPEYRVFVTTDASDTQSGAMLSFGKTWETSRPVAFDSKPFKGAELNYPVHEKELFAIVRALNKWRSDLLGVKFTVLTDHRTLECFESQKHLSRRQARWMELLQQYDFDIVYVKGAENTVADALSRTTFDDAQEEIDAWRMTPFDYLEELDVPVCSILCPTGPSPLDCVGGLMDVEYPAAAILEISRDDELYSAITQGYSEDPWCQKALHTKMDGLERQGDLLFYKARLVIPRAGNIRETLVGLAHNVLGHFGFDKTYAAMRTAFYWPGMRAFLENSYIPGCVECQQAKASTTRPVGPLHPLPVPNGRFASVAIDFVGPLPEEHGFTHILTMTDRLGADIRLVPCRRDISAQALADLFFDHWFCENGLPEEIISDRDILFLSRFWKHVHELTGVKLKLSTAFHPETDGASERTNKTLNQCLQMAVDTRQRGWVKALPRIRFNIMNTLNVSTGYSGFQLRLGFSPRLIPPLIKDVVDNRVETPEEFMERLNADVGHAADTLAFPFFVGTRVLLSTKNLNRESRRTVTAVDESHSTVTLDMPGPSNKCRVFHTSLVKLFKEQDDMSSTPGSIVEANTKHPSPGAENLEETAPEEESRAWFPFLGEVA